MCYYSKSVHVFFIRLKTFEMEIDVSVISFVSISNMVLIVRMMSFRAGTYMF